MHSPLDVKIIRNSAPTSIHDSHESHKLEPICCRIFEKIRYYFGNSSESIPMSFVLGFYVSLVVKRWWEQYKLLPWPDNLALFISAAIPGNVSTKDRTVRHGADRPVERARNSPPPPQRVHAQPCSDRSWSSPRRARLITLMNCRDTFRCR